MIKSIGLGIVIFGAVSSASFAAPGNGNDCEKHPTNPGCTMKAPEIDPSSAVAGLTLLAGGLAVMVGRRSRRLEAQAE